MRAADLEATQREWEDQPSYRTVKGQFQLVAQASTRSRFRALLDASRFVADYEEREIGGASSFIVHFAGTASQGVAFLNGLRALGVRG